VINKKLGAFLALFFISVSCSFADTIPATQSTVPKVTGKWASYTAAYPVKYFPDRTSSCNYILPGIKAIYPSAVLANTYNDQCNYSYAPAAGATHIGAQGTGLYCPEGNESGSNCIVYTCPAGQNWTLNGTQCTRPDCPSYQTRDPGTGVCGCPEGKIDNGSACVTVCSSGYHNAVPDNGTCIADCVGMQHQASDGSCKCDAKSYTGTANYSQVSSGCVGGCSISASVGFIDPVAGVKSLLGTQAINTVTGYYYIKQSGATCSNTQYQNVTLAPLPQDTSKTGADGTTPDPKNTTDNNKSPDACSGAGGSFIVVNGVSKCISDTANSMDKLTVSDKTKVTINTDGSSSTTTESTQQVCDASGSCTTIKVTNTTNTASGGGTSGSTTTETDTGSGSLAGEGAEDSKGQCAKEPNSPMCRTGVVAAGGSFPTLSDDIASAKAQYQTKFNEVKAGITSLVQANFSGGVGGLPCRAPITILGSSLEMCFTKFEGSLLVVGQFVILLGALASLFILFGRR